MMTHLKNKKWLRGVAGIACVSLVGCALSTGYLFGQTRPQAGSGGAGSGTKSGTAKETVLKDIPSKDVNSKESTRSKQMIDEVAILAYLNDADIPAQSDGIIRNITVDEGEYIKFDEPLIQLDDQLARAELEVATKEWEAALEKSKDVSNIEFSTLSYEVAALNFKMFEELRAKGATSIIEFEKNKLEADKARLGKKVAEIQHRTDIKTAEVNEAKVGAANVQISLRNIKAPFDGIVADRKKQKLDFVRAGEVILRLVGMEKLYVIGSFSPETVGGAPHLLEGAPCVATVTIGSTAGRADVIQIKGKISFVSPVLDAAGEYKVKMLIDNLKDGESWLLREGMQCQLEITGLRSDR